MRIAQIAPLYESVPPRLYGGTERVVSWLTEELVRQGHDVTLYASGDLVTSVRLVPACQTALCHDDEVRDTLPHHVRLVRLALRDAAQFDVMHFHCDYLPLLVSRHCPTPMVTTLHGWLHPHDLGSARGVPDAPLVSISDDQRRPAPG